MPSRLRYTLAGLAIVFNLLDNLTTYLSLRAPIEGFYVFEANPLAAWIFANVGLELGLILETVVSTAAVLILTGSVDLPNRLKLGLLLIMAVLPILAVANNLMVMSEIGFF